MKKSFKPDKVKLVVSVFSQEPELIDRTSRILERIFGKIDFRSPLMDFTHTEYYNNEMGCGLKRIFFGFNRPLSPESAYKAKLKTNALEKKFTINGKRRVNIDPGYLDMSKLVLFSTKDYTHRIPMPRGIFAEVTLFYQDKRYNPWPWTYPDYKTKEYADMFESIRNIYREGA
ncbi:MAG: DUF4416 family protein [Candidatus Omnitrophica bacterium]|nr:DUF4416 family protein [Candidatus Omnitrophota bacterium]